MSMVRKIGATLSAVAFLAFATIIMAPTREAEARPNYKKAFDGLYGKSLKKTDCNVCHEGKDKKDRNDYGKAVGEALGGESKVSDAKKVKKAIEEASGKENKDGKKYGELIKKGERPAG